MTVLIELKEKLKEFYGSCSGIVLPIVKFLLALAVFRGINSNLGYLKMLDSMYVVLILSLICAILPLNGMVFLAMLVIIGHCFALHMVIAGLAALVLLAQELAGPRRRCYQLQPDLQRLPQPPRPC